MPPLGTGGGQERLTLQELKLPQLTGTWRPQGKGAVLKKGTALKGTALKGTVLKGTILKGTALKGTIFKSDGEVEATQGRGGALATMAVETHTRQGGRCCLALFSAESVSGRQNTAKSSPPIAEQAETT